ncbi:hypothetical protein NKG94_27065 [Micromonospora sp. M12]
MSGAPSRTWCAWTRRASSVGWWSTRTAGSAVVRPTRDGRARPGSSDSSRRRVAAG